MALPVRDRSGFTLIELLVALVVSGLLVGVVFQLMQGQAQFVGLQSSREEVQQNARAALELIGSELRTVPDSVGISGAYRDSVSIRVPRVWGVICAAPGAASRSLRIPTVAGLSLAPTDSTRFASAVPGAAVSWTTPVRVTAAATSAGDCPASLGTTVIRVTMTGTPQNTAGVAAPIGARAYLFDPITYRIGTSAGMGGVWVERRSGGNGNQPLAGPILAQGEDRGLGFRYFAGDLELLAPVAAADLPTISSVLVTVRTVSRDGQEEDRQIEQDTLLVSIRNRS